MAVLTKDQILAADDLKTEVVSVPDWGGEVIVSTMTGIDRDKLEEAAQGDDGKIGTDNFRAKLLAFTLVDEQGNRLFTENEIEALGRKSASALNKVFNVAMRLNALRKVDEDEMVKN